MVEGAVGAAGRRGRRWWIPEVIQTSAMDCGPAALKALLEGFGISVSYGRLREACQTDVDGTSIDTLGDLAVQLGLDAVQRIVALDHALSPQGGCLPALAVSVKPGGVTHFMILWRRIGGFVQIMDPATGRRWVRADRLTDELFVHSAPMSAARWRAWAATEEFLGPLRGRARSIGVSRQRLEPLLARALADPGCRTLTALDASLRLVERLVQAKGFKRGAEAASALGGLLDKVMEGDEGLIPPPFWSARLSTPEGSRPAQVTLRGAVVVRVSGHLSRASPRSPQALSPELAAALEAPPERPMRALWGILREGGLGAPTAVILATALATLALVVEALLLQGLMELGASLTLPLQRLGGLAALMVFAAALLALVWPLSAGLWRMGRHLELRLRLRFLSKLPRIGDRYFQSRPSADMAERCHSIHKLRTLPTLGGQLLMEGMSLVATVGGLIALAPSVAPWALGVGAAAVAVPWALYPTLVERDLRVRAHNGALSLFGLDALLGLTPILSHGAEGAVQREHERLLVAWTRASRRLLTASLVAQAIQAAAGYGLAVWMIWEALGVIGPSGALLLVYWGLKLPALGQQIAAGARQLPAQRNAALRLMEPLEAPEVDPGSPSTPSTAPAGGAAIELEGVVVRAASHTLLKGISAKIEAGEHVALVGRSGAGKSTLMGLFLGWHRPAEGRLSVDGLEIDGAGLERLRRQTAWIDPSVQLWNRSMLDNLRFGVAPDRPLAIGRALADAELHDALERLPGGLGGSLGEGGALVSGGEGQRVRAGRAMLRHGVRLALLDEPFRGLDRGARGRLTERVRRQWSGCTLVCATHDLTLTRSFDRVLVIEAGRLIENGAPEELLAREDSHYRALLALEARQDKERWSGAAWRHLEMVDGRLGEASLDAEGA